MRYQHSGGARKTTLVAQMTPAGLEPFQVDDPQGYPAANFFVVIDRGLDTEEKVLVASRQGTTFTPSSRGADDTLPVAHNAGAEIEHVFTALEADEANAHVNSVSGVHGLSANESVASRGYVDNLIQGTYTKAETDAAIAAAKPVTYGDLAGA